MLWKQQFSFDISALNIFKYFKADYGANSPDHVIFNVPAVKILFFQLFVLKCAAVACMEGR